MRPKRSFLIVLLASVLVLVALNAVLSRNQEAGVYPVNADSISIPLFEGLFIVSCVLVLFGMSLLCPASGFFRWVGMFLVTLSSLVAMDSAWAWLIPMHYEIALAYGVLAGACLIFAWKRYKKIEKRP